MAAKASSTGPQAILQRAIRTDQDFMPTAARAVLKLGLDEADRKRLHELVVMNQDGALNADEQQELSTFLTLGLVFDLLHAKARRSLKRARQ